MSPNKAYLVDNLNIFFFFFLEMLSIYNFEGDDFRYANTFIKFQSKNIHIRQLCYENQTLLFSHKTLQINKFEGLISEMTAVFQNCIEKIAKQDTFDPKFMDF